MQNTQYFPENRKFPSLPLTLHYTTLYLSCSHLTSALDHEEPDYADIYTLTFPQQRRAPSMHFCSCCGTWRVLDIPPDLGNDHILALQPRTDTPISKHTKTAYILPEPQILEAVGSKICLVNTSNEPKANAWRSNPTTNF